MWIIAFSILVTVILLLLWRHGQITFRMFALLLALHLAGSGLSVWETRQSSGPGMTELARESAEDAGKVPLLVTDEDGGSYQIEVDLPYEEYTTEEAKQEIEKVMAKLDTLILGENDRPEHITKNLQLPTSTEDSAVSISWYSSKPDLLGSDGVIHASAEEGTEVILMADLTLQTVTENYRRTLVIFPSEEEESIAEQIRLSAEKLNEGNKKGSYYLPGEFRGKKLYWYRESSRKGLLLSGLALLIGLMWILRNRENARQEQEKRNEQMLRDYPGLLSKIQLYMHAGLSMRKVLERIEKSYLRRKMLTGEERYAYEEIVYVAKQMRNGMTELEAYEEFGKRCVLPCYKGLALMLTQNLKRGGGGLLNQLERESAEAFENRKREAKMAGEKAGIQLLLPMCLMLLVVMALVMIPAMLQF